MQIVLYKAPPKALLLWDNIPYLHRNMSSISRERDLSCPKNASDFVLRALYDLCTEKI